MAFRASKFHETLTRAWVLAVSHFMSRAGASFAEFAANSQPLLDSKVMLTHSSAETLFSPDARSSFVDPDLAVIPHSCGRQADTFHASSVQRHLSLRSGEVRS